MSPSEFARLRRYVHEAVWIGMIAVICAALSLIIALDTFHRTSSLTSLHGEALETARFVEGVDDSVLALTNAESAAASARATGTASSQETADNAKASFEAAMKKLKLPAEGDDLTAFRHDLLQRETALDRPDPVLDLAISQSAAGMRRTAMQDLRHQSIQAQQIQHRTRTKLSIAVGLAALCVMTAIVAGNLQKDHRRRIMRKLQQERMSAIAANRTKSSFLAYTSHELRTPLNAIIGFSEFMMMEYAGPLTERQKQYLSDIRGSGMHLQALISDILDLTKAEAGKITLNRQKLDIGNLVASCLKLIEGQANEAGVNLHVDLAPGLPAIDGDELRCKQVLINICSNAIQFTQSGGDVRLGISPEADGGVMFVISDTGRGIAPEDLPKVIEPYYRSGIDEPSHKGYGLGLPVARKIVILHGGSLAIASELGRGTTVTIRLPGTVVNVPEGAEQDESSPGNIIRFRR